ncbi:hypothetical protein DSECCO2_545020 [anaerobic digester metagenome]
MPLNEDAVNEILPFAPDGLESNGDLIPLSEYGADEMRKRGHQPGLARRALQNRAQRQAAHIAAGVAQFVANRHAAGVRDDGDLDAIEAGLEAVINDMIADGIPGLASTDAVGLVERATDAEAEDGTDTTRYVTPAHIGKFLRSAWAGIIVEWEASTIPTLFDDLPLGLELDGSIVSLTTYPRLLRKWPGAGGNATAPAWYRCTAGGTRDATGGFIKLQDRRGEFPRGWDHGRGVDAGRVLGSAQAASGIYDTMGNLATPSRIAQSVVDNDGFTTEAATTYMPGTPTAGSFSMRLFRMRSRNVASMFIVLV